MRLQDDQEAADLDLSGVWRGLFSYPRDRPPVSFTAALTETGEWVTGSTEEHGARPEIAHRTLTATVQGRRTGRAVTFLKTYDADVRGYDSVRYEGRINHDASEIEGEWTIPGAWSGKFLMIRQSGAAAARSLQAFERA